LITFPAAASADTIKARYTVNLESICFGGKTIKACEQHGEQQ